MDKSMEDIKRMICQELDEIADKGELSAGDLDIIYKLVITKEKLLRIEEIEGELGYSEGEWNAEGSYARRSSYDNSYDRANSYTRNARRSSRSSRRNGYGRDDVREKMMDMMSSGAFSNSQQQAIQRVLDDM